MVRTEEFTRASYSNESRFEAPSLRFAYIRKWAAASRRNPALETQELASAGKEGLWTAPATLLHDALGGPRRRSAPQAQVGRLLQDELVVASHWDWDT